MPSRDHERFRRQLEKQFRADVELLYGAYWAKLRAYETMHRLDGNRGGLGELAPLFLLPADLALQLPALPASDPVPAPAAVPRASDPAEET